MLKSHFGDLPPFAVHNLLSFFLYRIALAVAVARWAEPLAALVLSFVLVLAEAAVA